MRHDPRGRHRHRPGDGRNGRFDVGVRGAGRISAIEPALAPGGRNERGRRRGQARHRRDDRHPRARLRARHRKVRTERGHGGGAVGIHHRGRPGRPELHDHPRLPALRRRAGLQPGAGVHLQLPRRGPGGPLLPRALRSRGRQRGPHRARHRRKSRHRQGREVARGDRRRITLGAGGRQARSAHRARGARSTLHPPRPALAHRRSRDHRRGRVRPRACSRDGRGRRARPPVHPPPRGVRERGDRRSPSR